MTDVLEKLVREQSELTQAIKDHQYLTMGDLARQILSLQDDNDKLATALSAVIKDFDEEIEAEGFGIDQIPSVITARKLLEAREQQEIKEWLGDPVVGVGKSHGQDYGAKVTGHKKDGVVTIEKIELIPPEKKTNSGRERKLKPWLLHR